MNALTETAEREAQEAETDEPGEEEQAAEEEEAQVPDEPAAPEPTGLTEVEAEREFKKLEKLAQTYLVKAMAIADRLGMPYQVCPLDAFPGLAIPRSANEVTSDVEAAVLALIGKSAPPDLKMATDAEGCPDCDGEGDVLTGAKKEIARTKPCTRCGGKGWVPKPVQVPAPAAGNGVYTPPLYPVGPVGAEPPKPEPYYDYGTREWKLPPQPTGT